jgi:hypothetical protein
MIQCKDCELCDFKEGKGIVFRCNPFVNIKEPECLVKWQLMKLDHLIANQNMLLRSQQKLAPIQEKLIKFMEREIDDIEDTDSWKYGSETDFDTTFDDFRDDDDDDWDDSHDEEKF